MRKRLPVTTFMLLAFAQIPAAKADEISELRELISRQAQQLQQLQQRLDELEAKQKQQNLDVEEKISEAVENKRIDTLPESLQWADKIKISGDLRYRHEHIDAETGTTDVRWKNGRDRERIRARLMFEAMINDEWDVGFRLASGEREVLASEEDLFADPISSNQTLKQLFSSKDVWIDLAYFTWHPDTISGLNVLGGKVKNPFYNVGNNQLIWDTDLNPEGIGVKHKITIKDSDELHLNGGGFWVDESSGGADTSLWGAQTYLKHQISNSDYVLSGASYWDYGNIKGKTDTYGILAGNSGSGAWASDYDLFEVFGEYGTKWNGMPLAAFGSWVQNLVAASDGDTGWLIGVKLNKAKEPGSWEWAYDYRELQADAVVGAFTDSDFGGGGTDTKGHRVALTYQLARNLQAVIEYFHNENDGASGGNDLDYRRLHFALQFKF